VLVGEPEAACAAREELLLIGLDDVAGLVPPGALRVWEPLETTRRRPAAALVDEVLGGEALVLDVRGEDEHAAGRIPASRNIPLRRLEERLGELPRDRGLVVYCQAGYRSAVAASLLQAHGWADVTNMQDGFAAWQAAGAPVER
jgi:hydroxyacylglutathione hydrolase